MSATPQDQPLDDRLKVTTAGPVGYVTIDRPDSRGALDSAMWKALPEAIRTASGAEGVRVIVLRGTNGHFVAGADIAEFKELRSDPELARQYDRGADDTLEALARSAVPSIAMIGGACVGGGCLIAFGCDLRIIAADARIGIPAGKLGLAYPYNALERLAAVLGEAEALALTLTGRLLDGREAHRRGLAQYCVEAGELEAETAGLAAAVADNAPLALRYLRHGLRRAAPPMFSAAEVRALADACFESEDYAEGVRAFLEKRKPTFKGR